MFEAGRVVLSLKGNDAGQLMVVTGVGENGLIMVANGKHIKLDSPGRKNPRHLRATDTLLVSYPTDKALRTALNRLSAQLR